MATIGKSIETVLCEGPRTALQGRWSSSCMAPSRSTGHGMLFRRGDKLCHSWGLGCLDVSQNASLGQNAVRGNMGVSLCWTDVRLNFIRCVRQMGFWWWTICEEVVLKRTDNFLLKDYTSQFFLGPGRATPEERDYRRERNIHMAVIPIPAKVRAISLLWRFSPPMPGEGIISSTHMACKISHLSAWCGTYSSATHMDDIVP